MQHQSARPKPPSVLPEHDSRQRMASSSIIRHSRIETKAVPRRRAKISKAPSVSRRVHGIRACTRRLYNTYMTKHRIRAVLIKFIFRQFLCASKDRDWRSWMQTPRRFARVSPVPCPSASSRGKQIAFHGPRPELVPSIGTILYVSKPRGHLRHCTPSAITDDPAHRRRLIYAPCASKFISDPITGPTSQSMTTPCTVTRTMMHRD